MKVTFLFHKTDNRLCPGFGTWNRLLSKRDGVVVKNERRLEIIEKRRRLRHWSLTFLRVGIPIGTVRDGDGGDEDSALALFLKRVSLSLDRISHSLTLSSLCLSLSLSLSTGPLALSRPELSLSLSRVVVGALWPSRQTPLHGGIFFPNRTSSNSRVKRLSRESVRTHTHTHRLGLRTRRSRRSPRRSTRHFARTARVSVSTSRIEWGIIFGRFGVWRDGVETPGVCGII